MSEPRRVVVTGLGLVTPVGLDVEETWDALIEGRSGGAPITQFDASDQSVQFACEVKGFDPEQYMDRKEVRRADRFLQLAMGAAHQAAEQADIESAVDSVSSERFGGGALRYVGHDGFAGVPSFDHARIDVRVDHRLDHGMVDEVRSLLAAGVSHERLQMLCIVHPPLL